jgi:hypothetical protein
MGQIYFSGCGINSMIARQTVDHLYLAVPVFERESDLIFAESAIAGQIKLVEAFDERYPQNKELKLLLAQMYANYTYAFIQSKINSTKQSGNTKLEHYQLTRALNFYDRSLSYAFQAWNIHSASDDTIKDFNQFMASVDIQKISKVDIPYLFWIGFATSNKINLDQSHLPNLYSIRAIINIMNRITELDESYQYGSAHLILGVYYCELPIAFGGNYDKAEYCFNKGIKITKGKYLLGSYLKAQYLLGKNSDKEYYRRALIEIIESPVNLFPEQRLSNSLAKQLAKNLLDKNDITITSPEKR